MDTPTPPTPETKAHPACGFYFSLVVVLGFAVPTLWVDFFLAEVVAGQLQALDYASVEGEVVTSKVKEKVNSEGKVSYELDFEYLYRVGGRDYRSSRVRHLQLWDGECVKRFVAERQPETPVTVYYDPGDPARALLEPGLSGQELLVLMGLLPFNLIVFGGAGLLVAHLVHGGDRLRRRPVRVIEGQHEVRLRLPSFPAGCAALLVLFGGAILGVIIASRFSSPPSVPLMAVLWSILLGGAGLLYVTLAQQVVCGINDLVINRQRNTLTLPQTFGRRLPVVVPLADVVAVYASLKQHQDEGVTYTFYEPSVRWRAPDGELREGKLARWMDQTQADEIVALINEHIGRVSS